MKKITFIGAGSFDFTRELVRDILTYDAFQDAHICLMDIDPQKLSYIEKACTNKCNFFHYESSLSSSSTTSTGV